MGFFSSHLLNAEYKRLKLSIFLNGRITGEVCILGAIHLVNNVQLSNDQSPADQGERALAIRPDKDLLNS